MKKALSVIALIVTAGIIVYVLWRKKSSEQTSDANEDVIIETNENDETDTALETVKKNVATDIMNRHEEAANLMQDALNTIHENCDTSTADDEKLEKISSELDELLSEE